VPMLEATLTDEVELVASLDPALGHVRADRDQLQQVVHALAMNARDAMPDGGVLLVQTLNVVLDEAAMPDMPDGIRFTPGPYVLLAVSDTGVGMDAETQARIFEPFFTTKAPGKGSGLGLASVYGIVKQGGGFIFVRSQPRVGTRFTIYLPRVDEAPDPVPAVAAPAEVDARGDETVLVVEDEPMILDLACRVLRTHGYHVLGAASGEEALAIAAAHEGSIDLLVSDVVMPRMAGPALAEQLVATRDVTRVLYISGYTEGDIVRERVLQRGVQLLEKPFTPRQLLEKIRVVLDA
jgi:two-component system cell cycle sensor histidine kinase/response regulator CckA